MFNRTIQISVIVVGVIWTCCSAAEWRSPYYLDHPLVGKIYSLKQQKWVTTQHVDSAIRDARFLLLGETHTNPDHHQGQAMLISNWLSARKDSAVVLEMLSVAAWHDQPERWADLAELKRNLTAVAKEWQWELYEPILELAVDRNLPLIAANLSKQQRAYFAEQANCQVEQAGKKFNFCDTISPERKKIMEKLILDAHCGYLPAKHAPPLANTQIAKDASFALSLYRAGMEYNVVLIAGAVHVRKDIGVPRHLRRIGLDSVSIAFMPVDPDRAKPADYFNQNMGLQFDYIYFTPSERNVDPCTEFAEQLKRMKQAK